MWISIGSAAKAWLATAVKPIAPINHRIMSSPKTFFFGRAAEHDQFAGACNPTFVGAVPSQEQVSDDAFHLSPLAGRGSGPSMPHHLNTSCTSQPFRRAACQAR